MGGRVSSGCRFILAFILIVMASAFARAADEKRVALVIGVGAYQNAPGLANPPNDARLIAPALRQLGFDTELVVDPDYDRMKRALRDFGRRLDGAKVALFYYAGHGLQVGGRNYLLPSNASLAREADLRYEAFDVQAVLEQMDEPGRVNLVFLDACRDNPLGRSLMAMLGSRQAMAGRGLAPIETMTGGSLIAFATAPGDVALDGGGKNSPFTEALARHIATPGLDVRQMLTRVRNDVQAATGGRQRPWVNESMDSDFFFVPRPAPGPSVVVQSVPQATDIVFWQTIAGSKNPADYQAYLQQFPEGGFSALARLRLTELTLPPPAAPAPTSAAPAQMAAVTPVTPPPPPAAVTPAASNPVGGLAPPPKDQSAVTDGLTLLGFHHGNDVAAAIRQWQSFEGASETGMLSENQRDQVLDQARRLAALLRVPDRSPRGVSAAAIRGGSARFAGAAKFETGAIKDPDEAAYWYAQAAADNWAAAFTNLGTLMARPPHQDMTGARLLWLAAAARGETTALFNLGAMAENGLGGPADLGAARRWYVRGAAQKNAASIAALKRLGD